MEITLEFPFPVLKKKKKNLLSLSTLKKKYQLKKKN